MKCSICFRETETDPCLDCVQLTDEQRKLVWETLRPAVLTLQLLDQAFEIAFGAKAKEQGKDAESHRS